MSLESMDKDYVECCKGYLKNWIKKYDAEKYQISETTMEEIIEIGGEGLRELQVNFIKVVECAKQEDVKIIDGEFVNRVVSH